MEHNPYKQDTSKDTDVIPSAFQTTSHDEINSISFSPVRYITSHWRGDFSLVKSYWVNYVLVGFLFGVVVSLVFTAGKDHALHAIQIFILLLLLGIAVYIWGFVGCWRSANRHVENTGRRFWARVAQVLLVLGIISNFMTYMKWAPTLIEFIKVATRTEDFTDFQINVLENGEEIEVNGFMAFELEKELEEVLEDSPNAYLIHLNSPGGRIAPARKIRDLIELRNLSTYTATECDSAALIPFMAGRYRILNSNARLGFHAYSFPGYTRDQMALEIEADKNYFKSRGIDGAFLDKAFSVNGERLWYPQLGELIESKVITHTFDGETITSFLNE